MRLRLNAAGILPALMLLLASAALPAQTIALAAQNVSVPSTLLAPFTFSIPQGYTGTLWIGNGGAPPTMRSIVFLYTMDGKFYESFSNSGGQILNWPGLPAGDYESIVSFMLSGGGNATDYFVANVVLSPAQ